MATRRTPIRQWERDKAIGTRMVNRLLKFIYSDPENPADAKKQMTDAQVRACLGVLKKYMPDLKSIEHTGDPDRPVVQRIERVIVDPDPENPPDIPPPTVPE